MTARNVTLFLLITVVIAANFGSAKPVDEVGRPDLTSSEDGVQQVRFSKMLLTISSNYL